MIKLSRAGGLFVLVLVASCSSVDNTSAPSLQTASAIYSDLGEKVAEGLNRRYLDERVNCGKDSAPAFLCTGVLLRGTKINPAYKVWNNSPASIAKGGVSFSYLRKDVDFNRLAFGYTNGYFFMPIIGGDKTKIDPEIMCSFPVDAWTDGRADRGCGPYPNTLRSNLCRIEAIYTAAQWWQAYKAVPADKLGREQCGFDVDDSQNTAAGPAFAASLLARKNLGDAGFARHNEMIIKTWAENLGADLPLEAFFYLAGSTAGLADAKYNQQDLKKTDGVLIPIIKLTLPTTDSRPAYTPNAPAMFTYLPEDQTEPMPPVN